MRPRRSSRRSIWTDRIGPCQLWIAALCLAACGDDLPTICAGDRDAEEVVDVFWGTLDEEYALFDIRLDEAEHGSWADVGRAACDEVVADGSDASVFAALVTMARTLDDGHIQLESDFDDADGWASVYPYIDEMETLRAHAEASYAGAPLMLDGNGTHAWGRIGDVGYWSITQMEALSATGEEEDDVGQAERIADTVVAELADTAGIIVDVRANDGGYDRVSLAIAERFVGARTLAWQKALRDGPDHLDFTAYRDTEVGDAVAGAYDGPVVVLTSGATFSAGETFVLAMRVRDRVTVLGERSSGHFSDLYEDELPNGWSFCFSGERYRAAGGEIYEAAGVPVDVEVAFDSDALGEGTDVMLDAALAELSP